MVAIKVALLTHAGGAHVDSYLTALAATEECSEVVLGDPDASQLWTRMRHRGDTWAMPSRGTERVDEQGLALVRDWIASLPR